MLTTGGERSSRGECEWITIVLVMAFRYVMGIMMVFRYVDVILDGFPPHTTAHLDMAARHPEIVFVENEVKEWVCIQWVASPLCVCDLFCVWACVRVETASACDYVLIRRTSRKRCTKRRKRCRTQWQR